MGFIRSWLVLVAAVVMLLAPAIRAGAEGTARYPSSKHHAKGKHHKKKAKKGKKAKKAKHRKKHSASPAPSHYPTQPGGSGLDIQPSKIDDLPPPLDAEPGK
jgi:hypothetical protein